VLKQFKDYDIMFAEKPVCTSLNCEAYISATNSRGEKNASNQKLLRSCARRRKHTTAFAGA